MNKLTKLKLNFIINILSLSSFMIMRGQSEVVNTQMLFEQIGMVTTSVNYMHLSMKFDLATFKSPLMEYAEAIRQLGLARNKTSTSEGRSFIDFSHEDLVRGLRSLENDLDDLVTLARAQTELVSKRHKRFLAALFGGFGTFMSIYNTYQIGVLKSAVEDLKEQQDHMIEILQNHELRLTTVEHDIKKLGVVCKTINTVLAVVMEVEAVSLVVTRLDRGFSQLRSAIDSIMDLMQQAFHKRMSLRMVRVHKLTNLLDRLQTKAHKRGFELLITDPFHLFQLETSFIYHGDSIHLFVHIPMVRQHGLMKLFKFVPLPITFQEAEDHGKPTVLTFNPVERLIGVGATGQFHKALTLGDLGQCEKVGQTYVCRYHSIIHKNAADSCIGAIFFNKVHQAHEICPVLLHGGKETIHQLGHDAFSIYSPGPQQISVSCGDGTSNRINVIQGAERLTLKADCRAESEHHVFYSDYSLTEMDRFKQMVFPLNLAKATLHIPKDILTNISDTLSHLGEVPHDVRDLRQLYDFHSRGPVWTGHYWSWGALLIILFVLCVFLGCGAWFLLRRKKLLKEVALDQGESFIRRASQRFCKNKSSSAKFRARSGDDQEFEIELKALKPSAPALERPT